MYQPEHFRVEDVAQMHELMLTRPFAPLISCGSSGLYATHLPTVLKDEGAYGTIECHLARANPHWKDLAAGNEALMIFQGAEGYITPNWYPSKTLQGRADMELRGRLAYGRPEVMQDKDWLRRHVSELTAQQAVISGALNASGSQCRWRRRAAVCGMRRRHEPRGWHARRPPVCTENLIRIDCATESPQPQQR